MRNILRHAILGVSLLVAATSAAKFANADESPFFGRWTVPDKNEKFSSKGLMYKTFDVAPCTNDFCGVSVGEDGTCGPTLFRFLTAHDHEEMLKGHGLWGNVKKNIEISSYVNPDTKEGELTVDVGDGHDFGSREGSMPTYDATYKRVSAATCTAK
ncbi:hypothetical protein [Aestuariivirga litoralis]|uniref:hypothetical protein n=1 Tax=Aestuariivirga litoralis TaxID=2650924 RepID=UPI0018C6CC51|nr:hypothetical protein [Aestuariivirga litoralis]MBG1230910.1 hypothetical protein [Aestuariivirga litoralis]